ncbi:MAG: DUF11 domain-containing protein, partial [Sulfuricaulis sp.]|nr:DUF11 domain-containing protein [Sulfuricaulis sp.]
MALVCAVALFGCSGGGGSSPAAAQPVPGATTGVLNVAVNPAVATVLVTGPESYTQTFTGNQSLLNLPPGEYTLTATAPGFVDMIGFAVVAAAQTSGMTFDLRKTPTTGSLNVNVNPASAMVVVTGPASFTQTFTGNQFITDLEPGQYTATASAPGFVNTAASINVVIDETSGLSLVLQATPIITEAPRAVYRVGEDLIPLSASDVQFGQFSFYAWLQDQPGGISTTAMLANTIAADPGAPLVAEQTETAPSFTQNLATAWVGFTDAAGVIRPVIGADVRWEIDQWWFARVNSMQFGTSDDNRLAAGYGIFDDQADTRTNNARLVNQRFPLTANEYPLFNLSGIDTPNVDGFTWVTFFSPDKLASARIVAVATINGEEIGKQILLKNFAPQPKLEITKTVQSAVVNLVGGTAADTWTITVTNVGEGNATNIVLDDTLASGAGASYTLGAVPAGSTQDAGLDGFNFTIPSLLGGSSASVTYSPVATVTAAGVYCNNGRIASYDDSTGAPVTVAAGDLNAEACFTALESNVSIVKDFVVSATDNTSLGKSVTVATDVPATLRVQVINNGNGAATAVDISDAFDAAAPTTTGLLANYTVSGFSAGTPNVTGGFDDTIATLAANGGTATYLYTVAASVDAVYCDTATINSVGSGAIGIGSSSACLTVATPNLTITKTDAPATVMPGANYTSTIVVNNTGTAAATGVVISDLIGLNSVANVRAIYVSSSLNGIGGTLANNIITASTVVIPAGGSITFTVVSQIPPGAASGSYCDTATVTSTNSPTKEATACVAVPAFVALQTQLIDLNDPVAVGSDITYFSVLYVEALSNEGVKNSELTYSFGLTSPTILGIPGVFQLVSSRVYLDTAPVRDPITGLVLSDTSSPTAVLLTEGIDYTQTTVLGKQVITMSSAVILQPDTALYAVHVANVPSGTTTNALYTTSY